MTRLVAAVVNRAGVAMTALALLFAVARCGGGGFTGVAPSEDGGAGGEGAVNGAPGGTPGDNEGGTGAVVAGGSAGTNTGGTTSPPGGSGEAGQAGEGNVPITGEHHGYVVDTLKLPTTSNEANAVAFDVDGNGEAENQFGFALASLVAQGFNSNEAVAQGIQRGEAILLVEVQASSLSSAEGAALSTFLGKDPSPAACVGDQCGQHLLGTASFLLAEAPEGAPCAGSIQAGTFACAGGALPVRLGLPGVVLDFTLQSARAELSGVKDGGFSSGRLGGVIASADMNEQVFPALRAVASDTIERDCSGGTAPGCGCLVNSSGAGYIDLLDADDDCAVSLAEVKESSTLKSLFKPDVSLNGGSTPNGVSCAFTISGKRATFELP